RIHDASGCSMRALDLAVKYQNRGHQGWVLRLLGEIASHRADVEHAAAHYREALAVADELGMRPLAAHCHLGLARVCWRTGQRDEAREHLATAATLYREMDMRLWLDRTDNEAKQLAAGLLPAPLS